MTPEDIDNMQAGRDMDALIAEKIFDWIWCACPDSFKPGLPMRRWLSEPYSNAPRWDGVTEMPIEGLYRQESNVLEYSTDIAAAWQVVEKLTCTTKQWFHLNQFSTGCNAIFQNDAYDGYDAESDAETAPLAICRAALKAHVSIQREKRCRYPIPSAPGFHCGQPSVFVDALDKGYCEQHKAFGIGLPGNK